MSMLRTFSFPISYSSYMIQNDWTLYGTPMLTTVLRSQQEKNVEADTRIVVHVMHALVNGANVIQVRTVDTYVVVILVGTFHEMSALHPLEDIWVAFGMGKNFHFLSIKSISEYLGKEVSQGLPVFHSFTGSDTTSAFRGKGKKSAWQAWQSVMHFTDTLQHIALNLFGLLDAESPYFKSLMRFTVVLYSKNMCADFSK